MSRTRDRGVVVALGVTDAAVLWLARPDVGALIADLAHPYRWIAAVGTDGAVSTLAHAGLWLWAIWVAAAIMAVAASALPGAGGQLAAAVAAHAVPAVFRRMIAGALGASIFLAPLAAGAATPDRGPARPAVSLSALVSSSATGPRSPAAPLDDGSWSWPRSTSRSTHTDGDPVATPVPWPHTPSAPPAPAGIVVRPGDSLWAIAAHRLGPQADAHQIAYASEQWYQANKATIGSDPRLIHPGQHLQQPTEKSHRS